MEDPHIALATAALDSALNEVFRNFDRTDGWEALKEKEGITGAKIPAGEGPLIIKTRGTVNKSPEQVLAFLWDFNNKRVTDPNLKEIRVVKTFTDSFRILYEQTNAPWPVSNRDFVYAQRYIQRDDGFLIQSRSIDGIVPDVKGVIRAENLFNGIHIKRTPQNTTELNNIGCVDLKGSIPSAIINKMANKQLDKIIALRKALG